MRDRNQTKLDKLKVGIGPEEGTKEPKKNMLNKGGALLNRQNALGKIAGGKQRTVQLYMHPPERIRIWEGHNRKYELLSAERCSDLIEGLKRTGKQEFPAIVRRVEGDEKIDYEVICGARRKWTVTHLGWELLIEVRELNDRQAFILQDLENRDREDISDYERALDYKRGLQKYFENNRSQMARFLEIDISNFSKFLDLAEVPRQIVEAYGDLRELKTHHGTTYKKILQDAAAKRRVVEKARGLKGVRIPGKKVFTLLKEAGAAAKNSKGERRTYGALAVTVLPNGGYRMVVRQGSGDRRKYVEGLRKDFDAFVEEFLAGEG